MEEAERLAMQKNRKKKIKGGDEEMVLVYVKGIPIRDTLDAEIEVNDPDNLDEIAENAVEQIDWSRVSERVRFHLKNWRPSPESVEVVER